MVWKRDKCNQMVQISCLDTKSQTLWIEEAGGDREGSEYPIQTFPPRGLLWFGCLAGVTGLQPAAHFQEVSRPLRPLGIRT